MGTWTTTVTERKERSEMRELFEGCTWQNLLGWRCPQGLQAGLWEGKQLTRGLLLQHLVLSPLSLPIGCSCFFRPFSYSLALTSCYSSSNEIGNTTIHMGVYHHTLSYQLQDSGHKQAGEAVGPWCSLWLSHKNNNKSMEYCFVVPFPPPPPTSVSHSSLITTLVCRKDRSYCSHFREEEMGWRSWSQQSQNGLPPPASKCQSPSLKMGTRKVPAS